MDWLSAFTAVVASATAIFIALVVYPKQKSYDRKNEMQSEKREAYRDYFRAAAKVSADLRAAYFSRNDQERAEELLERATNLLQNLYLCQEMLAFYAPDKLIELCRDYTAAIIGHRSHLYAEICGRSVGRSYQHLNNSADAHKQVKDTRIEALVFARADTTDSEVDGARRALKALLETERRI